MEINGCNVMQTANHHVWIIKDGKAIEHIVCEEKKSEEDLKEIAYSFFNKHSMI